MLQAHSGNENSVVAGKTTALLFNHKTSKTPKVKKMPKLQFAVLFLFSIQFKPSSVSLAYSLIKTTFPKYLKTK
jgi:hypothetical protein